MENKKIFISNNFDLIRLFAALQVVLMHGYSHLDIVDIGLSKVLSYFPGVPIFFFISGYLISSSYANKGNIFQYTINRAVRIYPALIVCTLLSVLAVYLTGYFSSYKGGVSEFFLWILGQISFVQFYNPDFMREFGTGVLNGSLWTISVELQLYL
jgi:peptidoglycan/LPS O-acetylase OafA/YrhL